MGDPKKQRKKFATPRFPWRTDILQAELNLMGQYGLRNKHELWRHETFLSRFRGIARSLIGETPAERRKQEAELLNRLKSLGILDKTAVLDNALDLTIESILERRLQTIVYNQGLAKTLRQARQLITHGHITINKHKVTVPSYLVKGNEEKQVTYASKSPLSIPNHTLRQTLTIKTSATINQRGGTTNKRQKD